MARTLETILTARNLLSPELRQASRDVRDYANNAEQANNRAGASAEQSANRQRQANERVSQSSEETDRRVQQSNEDTNRRRQQSDEETTRRTEENNERRRRSNEDTDRQSRVSAEEASRRIGALRSELANLGNTRLGVDADTVDARMQLTALREQLDNIRTSEPSARVQAETQQAEAQLRTIQSQLNRIDGQRVTATVDVNDNGSIGRTTSNLSALGMAALAVGPALGSVGAVGLAGLGAISGVAAGGAAGLGVLALGFSGVGDAVKLLEQQQTAAAAEAAKASSSQVQSAAQQAAAVRQVQSAQDGLANARANADDAAVRSASAVTRASENVQQAEQQAARGVADAARKRSDAYADAARQQEQSQRDVADAVDQATSGVNSALRQQEQAEKSLGSAQRDARQAQADLTDARKSAQQQIEDTTASVADNALAQRQATFDLADAQKDLDEARASGDADAIARAELAFERQQQRGAQLITQGRRLAEQQAENDRTGVEGSRQVVAAQQRVADTNTAIGEAQRAAAEAAAAVTAARTEGADRVARAEQAAADTQAKAQQSIADAEDTLTRARQDGAQKVTDAQRAVSDAVRDQAQQQRQSAYSIEQAQAGVTAALAAVAAASTDAGDAGSAALDSINAKLDEVNPSTRRFAEYVDGTLKPAFERMQESAAAGLLPGVEAGLDRVLTYEPQINGFLGRTSSHLGDLANQAGATFTDPFWLQFFGMIDRTAIPAMDTLYDSGINVAHGFAGILMAFEPMSLKVGGGIRDLTGDFADWGENLKSSEGFHQFTDYVEDNWPKVREIVGNVVDIVGDLVEAGMPIGGAWLTGLQLASDVLSGLPVGVVQALLVAFLAYKTISGVTETVTNFSDALRSTADNSDRAHGSLGRFSGLVSTLGLSVGTAAVTALADNLNNILTTGDDARDAIDRVKRSIDEADSPDERFQAINNGLDELRQRAEDAQKVLDAYNNQGWFNREVWSGLNETSDLTDAMESIEAYNAAVAEIEPQQGEAASAVEEANATIAEQDAVMRQNEEATSRMVDTARDQLGIYSELLADKTAKEQEAAQATATANGDTSQSWRDHLGDVHVSLEEYAAALDEDVAKKDAWREDVKAVTERGGEEVGAALLAMGEEGAQIADDLANATDQDFQRMAEAMTRHAREGGAAAAWEMEVATGIMAMKSREGAKLTSTAIAEELRIGVADAARIASDYGITLADGVNPVLQALGKKSLELNVARGKRADQSLGGYAEGGYTGDGDKHAPAGVVHRGEYVITKERTAKLGVRNLENLERILPGYAGGGLVEFGRRLQGMGARVAEHPAFPPLDMQGHGRTSKHYTGDAIDVNTRAGTSALEQRELAPMAEMARQMGFGTIFMSAGHFGHLHVQNGATSASLSPMLGLAAPVVLPKPPSTAPFGSPISTAADAVMQRAYDDATAWVAANTTMFTEPAPGSAPTGSGVERWRGTVMEALSRVGQPATYVNTTLRRMQQESGGNPRAINNWDVNATRGTPSKGLMQVIDPTFRANRDPGLVNDIWDPLANIVASMNYAVGRYGNLPAAYDRKGGYANGGTTPAHDPFWVGERGPELLWSDRQHYVSTAEQSARIAASPTSMPGYGMGVAGAGISGPGKAPSVTVHARVFVGDREITDIARIEAEAAIDRYDTSSGDDVLYATGG